MMSVVVRSGCVGIPLNPVPVMIFMAEAEREPGFVHVLLITTGSVASVKAPLIVKELLLVGPHPPFFLRIP